MARILPLFLCLLLAGMTCAQTRVVFDTDCGTDDLMALAYLLSRTDVRVEAITTAKGLARVERGAENMLRLLALAGRHNVPVYIGSETPMRRTADFPEEWRRVSENLPGVTLPAARRRPESRSAAEFLAGLRDPVVVLATGGLTNIAQARVRHKLVIMGGAVRVPGNLGDGGFFKTTNKAAEWNIYVDPLAARRVFDSGAPIDLVPLDATNQVPIGEAFLDELSRRASTPLARFVVQVLESERDVLKQGIFYAWDPLAAVALVEPDVVQWTPMRVRVNGEGRTVGTPAAGSKTRVALSANAEAFRQKYLGVLLGR